jgi:protein SCO1/2
MADETAIVEDTENPTPPDDDPYGLNRIPEVAKDIGVESKIGDFIDPDSPFHDHDNRFVNLGDYFDGQQPVMLSFNYSNCPKLCSVQLENMVATLAQIKFRVGTDFKMVSISIDPTEQTSRARKSKDKYAFMYNKGESVDGFHFLTGKREEIKYVADTCGFQYKYVKEQKLFSHPPVFILVSPEGKIVRYIHGLDYDPGTIEKALIEAAEGKIGSPINQFSYALGCFVFDESTGKYTIQAMAIMRIGGLLTILGLAIGIFPYFAFRHRRTNTRNGKTSESSDTVATAPITH